MLQVVPQAAADLPVTVLCPADTTAWLAQLQDAAAGVACLVLPDPAAPARLLWAQLWEVPVTNSELLLGPWVCLCLPCLHCNWRQSQ